MTTSKAVNQTGLDTATVRQAFAHYPAGVVAMVAAVGGVEAAMVASSFTVGISAEPPLVSVAIQRTSTTWPRLRSALRIGISVFAEDQAALARQMAGPNRDRLADVQLEDTGSEARMVAGASSWFECTLYNEVDAGDHTLALLEVTAFHTDEQRPPLVFHGSGFRSLAP
ncbi:flavin reductase family protein [Conyzicola nivalis]|uniref:Oxidoreductase n=1 Tax=Conyzicola nivalis TaxID=1477021 RepID=A0A916SKY5_9MICO|nr:flavin reductase family protein [Conyzicola nivalis]GGB02536.1 oxidoreductase [Conyzicola nivalis]